jgi:hypothetical protein
MGTPVPNKANEEKGRGASEVITYRLSPEEWARYRTLDKNGKPEKRIREEKAMLNEVVPAPRRNEETNDAPKLTRELYIQERLAGLSRTEISRKYKLTPPAFYARLSQWRLKERHIEDEILAGYAKEKTMDDPEAKKTEMTDSLVQEEKQEDRIPVDQEAFEWTKPTVQIIPSAIRITKRKFRIVGPVAEVLRDVSHVSVGFAEKAIALIPTGSDGWRLCIERNRKHGFVIYSQELRKLTAQKGFGPGTVLPLVYDGAKNMLVGKGENAT